MVGVTDKQKVKLSKKILTIERTNNIIELARIYSAADIFLNASVEETFGLVSLEALACGTPVITNKNSANPELINSKCGMIVEDITTQSFIDAINKMKIEPINNQECIKRAHEYNKIFCIQKYMDLYSNTKLITM